MNGCLCVTGGEMCQDCEYEHYAQEQEAMAWEQRERDLMELKAFKADLQAGRI